MSTKHHHAQTASIPAAIAQTIQTTPATPPHISAPSPISIGVAAVLALAALGYGGHKLKKRFKKWRKYRNSLYRPKVPAFLDRKDWNFPCSLWPRPKRTNGVHGNARLAVIPEIAAAGYFPSVGIPLGRSLEFPATAYTKTGLGPWIRFAKDGHLMTIAPPGVGKARDVQITVLLYRDPETGVWIIIDPKGQLAAVTYKAMNSNGRRAVYINPFRMFTDILGAPTGYNPMTSMDPATIHFAVDCDSLAQAIVVYVSGEPHWTDSAQILISAFIYYFRKYGKPDEQNLVSVRTAIGLPPKAFRALINTMADTGDHLLIERISRFIDMQDDDREALCILSTAKTQTAFIGNEAIRESLKGTENFSFKDLRETPGLAVFIILPGEYLDTCSKWFRVLVASALRELLADREGETVNFMLDEFAQLGHLKAIENTIALARGYGVRMWPILQDLGQLRRHYPDSWETFLSSSSVVQFFGVRDLFSAEWIERRAGQNTAKGQGTSTNRNDNGISRGTSTGEVARPAISAQDAMSLGENEQIIFAAGIANANAIIAQRLPYWKIDGLQGTWLPDPYHTKRRPAKAAPTTPPAPQVTPAAPVTP